MSVPRPKKRPHTNCTDCSKWIGAGGRSAWRCDRCLDRRREAKRRNAAAGRCRDCNRPVRSGLAKCARCRARAKTRYRDRAMAGLCPRCGQPNTSEHIFCSDCRAVVRDALRRLYRRRRSAGLCIQCAQEPPADGVLLCAACGAHRAAQAAARRNRADTDDLLPAQWRLLESLGGQRR